MKGMNINRPLVGSSLYLVVALLFAGYALVYEPLVASTAGMRAVSNTLTQENQALDKALKDAQARAQETGGTVNSLPAFLRHVNSVARETGVIIQQLTPNKEGPLSFTLSIIDDYLTFLKFAARLESLNVNLHNLAVHPYNLAAQPPTHAISFSLTPRNDAAPLSGERLTVLAERIKTEGKRNPFQRFAVPGGADKVEAEIDLTWVNKLSGLGNVGDKRYATIDGRDYQVGDEFDGKTVTTIMSDRVKLERKTANGIDRFILRFRIGGLTGQRG